ncbi:MAG TPA: exosortase/archaeosortase family protein [Planctomycetota bacterium]|nr:exosortase/archaeosortase family protein [Planctomycetota bacterium]
MTPTASATTLQAVSPARTWGREWLVFAVLLGVAFWPVLVWMYDRWMAADSYTSHGLLIPLISGWFVWKDWPELQRMPRRPAWTGLLVLGLSLLLFFFSGLLRVYFTSGFALVGCLVGVLAYWGGWAWVRRLWFPLLFLVFMLPLPEIAIARMNLALKLFVTKAAVTCADMSGVPVVMDGAKLHLENGNMVVGDVCSGLRSMIALIALGVLYAYLYAGKSWLVRAALLAAVIPIAMAANMVRIYLNILFAHVFGQELLFRPLLETSFTGVVDIHILSGVVVFIVALGLLYLTMIGAEALSDSLSKRADSSPAGGAA